MAEEDAVLAEVLALDGDRGDVLVVFVEPGPRERQVGAAQLRHLARDLGVRLGEDRAPTRPGLDPATDRGEFAELHDPLHRHARDLAAEVYEVDHQLARQRQRNRSTTGHDGSPWRSHRRTHCTRRAHGPFRLGKFSQLRVTEASGDDAVRRLPVRPWGRAESSAPTLPASRANFARDCVDWAHLSADLAKG